MNILQIGLDSLELRKEKKKKKKNGDLGIEKSIFPISNLSIRKIRLKMYLKELLVLNDAVLPVNK